MIYDTLGLKAKVGAKLIKEPKHNIRIVKSTNRLKLPVARVCAEWLAAPDRYWGFNGSIDKNSTRLTNYLREMFPDYKWIKQSSQKAFDSISLDARMAVEFKSVKKGKNTITANATVYPTYVPAVDILTKDKLVGVPEDLMLDVLVVCVERDEHDKVHDFRIVDGDFWGVTTQDYRECAAMFGLMNDGAFMTKFYKNYRDTYPDSCGFINKMSEGSFGSGFDFKLRKLIQLTNPVSVPFGMSGVWNICGK